jgi:hypothetical protein
MNARSAWGPRISDMKGKRNRGYKAMTARPVSLWPIISIASNSGKAGDGTAEECGFLSFVLQRNCHADSIRGISKERLDSPSPIVQLEFVDEILEHWTV